MGAHPLANSALCELAVLSGPRLAWYLGSDWTFFGWQPPLISSCAQSCRSLSTWAEACQATVRSCSSEAGSAARCGREPSLDSRLSRLLADVPNVDRATRSDLHASTSPTAAFTALWSLPLCASRTASSCAACSRAAAAADELVTPVAPLAAVLELGEPEECEASSSATTAMTATAPIARAGISGPRDFRPPRRPGPPGPP